MVSKRISISAGLAIMAAMTMLILPIRWVAALAVATLVHETGHCLAIRLLSGRWQRVQIRCFAARISLPEMDRWKELACALAGPAAGAGMLLLRRWVPCVAICALGQTVYNLLPIYPLDGGRALRCLLSMVMLPLNAARVCHSVEFACRMMLIGLSIYAAFRFELGIWPLLLAGFALFRRK